jgi:hypothetical protein
VRAVIDFRYHLVSIIAVFVALAVGIVLGSGPLKGPIDDTLRDRYAQVESDKEALRDELSEAQSRIDYLDEAAATYPPSVLHDRLAGRAVVLLTMPGTDGGLVNATRDTIELTGATVSGTVGITEAYLDPDQLDELEGVLDELTPQGTAVPAEAEGHVRAGAVLAGALVTNAVTPAAQEREPDAGVQALLTGLQEAGFVTIEGQPAARAALAVLVTPVPPADATDTTQAASGAQLQLALATDRLAVGSVVTGPIGAAGAGGLVEAVRQNDEAGARISTVDTLDTSTGRATAALALVEQAGDRTVHYGIGPGAQALAPDLSADGEAPSDGSTPGAAAGAPGR